MREIDDPGLSREKIVHQVRKRCKKLRGLLRLFRPALGAHYQRENARFRDLARRLAGARDADVLVETFDSLVEHRDGRPGGELMAVRDMLTARRRGVAGEQVDARLAEVRDALTAAQADVACWTLNRPGFDSVRGGIKKTYRRGRDAMHDAFAEPSPARFHEWRKRVKYHWYHVRLLRDLWQPVMEGLEGEIDRLGDLLGTHHDLAVLQSALEVPPQVLSQRIAERQSALIEDARDLGRRIYAEKPGRLIKRLAGYWRTVE